MTEAQVRQKIVAVMQSWIGCKESDGSHKKIIDIYNGHKPLARNYTVKYTDAWCAPTVSAAAIEAGLTDIVPIECSCGQMIELFKKIGRWVEDDGYVPAPGDYIFYDWDDTGKGDCIGWPEHVGMVEKIVATTITVMEGNKSDAVGRRNIQVGGRYIRGYGIPDYASKATKEADVKENCTAEINTGKDLKVGDVVNFIGNRHYTSSGAGAKSSSCRAGQARVTSVNIGAKHPYHLVAVSGKGSNVYGWVNASDIEGESTGSSDIKVGDTVEYTGTKHYSSSYAGAKASSCKGGTAKVTAINKNGVYKYHLVHTGKGCTVYGWVDAKYVSK